MRKIASLLAELLLESKNYKNGMKDVANVTTRAARQISSSFNDRVTRSINDATVGMQNFGKASNFAFKDIQRVAFGIVEARALNLFFRTIKNSAKEVINYKINLERAALSFETFNKSAKIAKDLVRELKERAALTPFRFEDVQQAAKALQAFGFNAKDTLKTIDLLNDAIAATGGTGEDLNRIAVAIGKIKASGRATRRELRPFINANIKINDILKEQLNLTEEGLGQLIRAGGLTSDIAIPAILRGLEEFDGAAEKFSQIIIGLTSTIRDNLLEIGSILIDKPFESAKDRLKEILEVVKAIREVGTEKGGEALFDRIVPEGTAETLKLFIVNIKLLAETLKNVLRPALQILGTLSRTFIEVFNLIAPPILVVVNALAKFTSWLLQTNPLVRALVQALSALAVASFIASKVIVLGNAMVALTTVMKDAVIWISRAATSMGAVSGATALLAPKIAVATALFVAAAAGAIWLAKKFGVLNKAINVIKQGIADLTGIDIDLFTLPDIEETAEEYENAMDGMSDSIGDIEDASNKAGKAFKKFLAPFDEVIRIPEQLGAVGGAIGDITPGADSGEGTESEKEGLFDKALQKASDFAEELRRMLNITFPALKPPILEFAPILSSFKVFERQTGRVLKTLQNRLNQTVENAGVVGVRTAQALAIGFGTVIPLQAPILNTLWQNFKNYGTNTETEGAEIGKNTADALETNLSTFIPLQNGILGTLFNDLQRFGVRHTNEGANTGVETANSLDKGFSTSIPLQNGILGTLSQNLITWGKDSSEIMKQNNEQQAKELAKPTAVNALKGNLAIGLEAVKNHKTDVVTTTQEMQMQVAEKLESTAPQNALQKTLEKLKSFWEDHKETIINVTLGGLVVGIAAVLAGMSLPGGVVATAVGGFFLWLGSKFEKFEPKLDGIAKAFGEFDKKVGEKTEEWGEAFKSAFTTKPNITMPTTSGTLSASRNISGARQFARGGIVDRNQLIEISEGNKREAVIPLENPSAMQPFSNAVAGQVASSLQAMMPTGQATQQSERPIVYVHTLIADERGLKELERKLEIVRAQEQQRKNI